MAQTSSASSGHVVMVTGASGLLGRHLTYLLLTRCDDISKIITVDVQPFSWVVGMEPPEVKTPLRHVVCDLTNYEEIDRVCRDQNVDVVFNTAGYVDIGTGQDKKKMYSVNVKAVENVVRACINNSIPHLVHTSSQDVAVGFEPIRNVDDDTATVPKKFLYHYAKTKYEGERVVVGANNTTLRNGGSLKTVSLRPCAMYGEGDRHGVTSAIRNARARNGVLPRYGNPKALFQEAYAGNIAWGHILAMLKLQETTKPTTSETAATDSVNVDGKCFFIMDETPPQNGFEFCRPYLEACGCRLSDYMIPFWAIFLIVLFFEIATFLLWPIKRIDVPMTRGTLYYMKHDHYFNYDGARKHLGYRPIYSPEEAKARSMVFYKSLD
ncbi:3 beta-hydroxysteroid dehydrogenase/Delta 5--_4-isomerase type 1-like [Ptychodera flava]|uniref:3 beta-hydroxysteroid dehydrogenase/Delta 5-->4-isomerase type 1-like n=1 Tax=Ptychodera flava TaxID=63121 RepID=UPI00396A36F9